MSRKREEIVRRLRGERAPRRVPWKFIVGILVTIAVFAFVCYAFDWKLGWPTSLITLGVMLAVAWFVGFFVGEHLAPRWSMVASSALALALLASTLGFGVPWELPTGEAPEETVLFRVDHKFTYLGSEDNLPVENIVVSYIHPHVENRAQDVRKGMWTLYWKDEDNVLHRQMWGSGDEVFYVWGYLGDRKENLEILGYGAGPAKYGPAITYVLDRLYPREVFWISAPAYIPEGDADRVTLKVYGDDQGRSAGMFGKDPYGPLDKPIDVSFWVQLSRRTDDNFEVVETFGRTLENFYEATLWLHPMV